VAELRARPALPSASAGARARVGRRQDAGRGRVVAAEAGARGLATAAASPGENEREEGDETRNEEAPRGPAQRSGGLHFRLPLERRRAASVLRVDHYFLG